MARIKHPNPLQGTFTDRIGGVVFRDGYAEVDLTEDPNLRDAYLMHGYEVEVADKGTPFFDLTVPELRDLAETEGIDIPKGAKKAEIVRAFLDAATTEFAVVELPDGTVIGDGKSIATLYVADES